ncbi:MAG: hypothetical protein ACJ741_07955 [Pyrinomonadaceae bacterium]
MRGAAHFCPQCGQSLAGAASAPAQARTKSALVEEAERVAASISGKLLTRDAADAPRPDVAHAADMNDKQDARALDPGAKGGAGTPQSSAPAVEGLGGAARAEERPRVEPVASPARGVRQRAASVGAGVGDSLRPRVDKLRERSAGVFDEAADDPGLRFVLVAALLFVVALLLFIFSFALK